MIMNLLKFIIFIILFNVSSFANDLSKMLKHTADYSKAIAIIMPTEGNSVKGTFIFEQLPDGVKVSAVLTGLGPNQRHGVHIHQWGDISDMKNGKTVGGHYNPQNNPHGLPPNPVRHAGAFGNIETNDKGEASFSFLDNTITIVGLKNPIIGRAVVVHAKEDTGEQPAGNAGPRIGVGIIGITQP